MRKWALTAAPLAVEIATIMLLFSLRERHTYNNPLFLKKKNNKQAFSFHGTVFKIESLLIMSLIQLF